MTSLGKGQEGDFFMYAQGFRVNAACTAASPANNYTYDDVLQMYLLTKMPTPIHVT